MSRLRICQLITELRPAGAERCVYELARRLDRRRFAVHVAALRGGAVADWLAAAGVGVTVLGVRGKLDAARLPALVRILRDQRVDLLHTHLFHADLVGRLAARAAGVGHLIHTVHVAEARWRPWQYAWACVARRWCDRIVCVSEAVLAHHTRKTHLPRSCYQLIRNGIDPAAYARDEQRRRELRGEWGVEAGQVVLAFVGRLDYQKNVGMFLQAARLARQAAGDIRAVIAGDGPDRPVVEQFLRDADNARWVQWLGHSEDVPGLLSAADIFVQSSRWEGLPLAPAEAMAAGLPVIGTRVPGLTELVVEGATGLLVDSEDVAALADAVTQLADDGQRRDRLGSAGKRRIVEHFSIDANVAAHESLYGAVAGLNATQVENGN